MSVFFTDSNGDAHWVPDPSEWNTSLLVAALVPHPENGVCWRWCQDTFDREGHIIEHAPGCEHCAHVVPGAHVPPMGEEQS